MATPPRVSDFTDGRYDLIFQAQSLKTSQSSWTDIGHDIDEALARATIDEPSAPAPTPEADAAQPDAPPVIADAQPALAAPDTLGAPLAALGAHVGDGQAWQLELADAADAMDAAVARHASYMAGGLFETIDALLGFLVANVQRYISPADLAFAASTRTIVFEFVELDDCPRPFTGAFQAVTEGDKLYFVGPAERERKLAASLAALAATSSTGSSPTGRVCSMCKGARYRTCNGCHGKGGSCTYCKGSGRSRARCASCNGAGRAWPIASVRRRAHAPNQGTPDADQGRRQQRGRRLTRASAVTL